jgi:hypothetical protein
VRTDLGLIPTKRIPNHLIGPAGSDPNAIMIGQRRWLPAGSITI